MPYTILKTLNEARTFCLETPCLGASYVIDLIDVALVIAESQPAEQGAWQPIATAPKERKHPLLLASPRHGGWRIWATEGYVKGRWLGIGSRNPPDYWQPLPAPPAGGEE